MGVIGKNAQIGVSCLGYSIFRRQNYTSKCVTSQRKNNPTIEISLTDIAPGGYAVGHYKGHRVLVPYAIPGERVAVRLINTNEREWLAEGVQLIEASADRIKPRCPHFGPGRCGGCQWQHMTYQAQIALKTDIVIDQLTRFGGLDDPPVQFAIACPSQWGYSSQATFFPTKDDQLGFRATDPRQITPIEECHIVLLEVMRLLDELDLDLENLREVRLNLSEDHQHLLVLRSKDDNPPELEITLPVSVNFLLSDNEPFNMVGSTHVVHQVDGRWFRVTAGVSFRPNVPQIETLTKVILDYLGLRGGESVLDLYGGVGIFSAMVSDKADFVTYVDSYPPAATDAEDNLADLENVDIIEGSVESFLGELLENGQTYDAVILDPPHTGLTDDAIEGVGDLKFTRLVYVSQDPVTLARDVKILTRKYGYQLMDVQPIDFAPQTANIQCVALLEHPESRDA